RVRERPRLPDAVQSRDHHTQPGGDVAELDPVFAPGRTGDGDAPPIACGAAPPLIRETDRAAAHPGAFVGHEPLAHLRDAVDAGRADVDGRGLRAGGPRRSCRRPWA